MKLKFLMPAIAVAFFSCEDSTFSEQPLDSYDNGIFVVNEGNGVSGSVSFISNDLQTVQHEIFSLKNPDQMIGGYLQSMFFDGDRAFIISNISNIITVVDRQTFQYLGTISGNLDVPRYGVVADGKAYVTNLAGFSTDTDDFISIIDLSTLQTVDMIDLEVYAERIVAQNGILYVTNGSFGSGDSITVIDAATKTILDQIPVGTAPNSLEIHGEHLYVLCSGFTTESKLVKVNLNDFSDVTSVIFPESMGNAFNLDIEGNIAYFSVGPKVYKMPLDASSIADSPLFNTNSDSDYIGYGFAVNGNRIYISEASEDFSSDGRVYIYSIAGEFIDEIPAGLGPNGFYFN